MAELKDRLRIARKERGLTQSDVARLAGVTPQAIQAIEAGKVRKPANILAIAAAVGVPAQNLMDGKSNGHSKMTPIIGVVQAGTYSIDYSVGEGTPLGEVDRPAMATHSTVALEVRGDSMGGRVEDGDIIFYDERREPVTPDLYGKLCVIGATDGRVMLKRLKPGSRPGRFHLISYAADPEFDVPVDWAAKVTSIRPRP